MENLNALSLVNIINEGMDVFVSFILVIGLLIGILLYTLSRIQKDGPGKGIYLGVLAAVEAAFLAIFFYFIPQWVTQVIEDKAGISISAGTVRWVMLYLLGVPGWYLLTRRDSGRRGLYSILIILTTFLLGWLYNRWIGILFISAPILLIYFHVIDKLAQATIPASNPEDKKERWQKTSALLAYILGVQYPFWRATKKAGRELDMLVPGNSYNDFGKPGIAWTWSHQVVGLSTGIEFNRVGCPGTTFTQPYEFPVALVDLRTQLRVSIVDAVTKDGMKVPAVVFMAFAIDREKWPQKEWSRAYSARIKYLFGNGMELDHAELSYPYSSGRVRSVLSTAGINTSLQENERPDFYWDEWVVKQVEHATRQVLSNRSLDELWRPINDGLGVSALDEMAKTLKALLVPCLTEIGVNLFTARIVNYGFEEDSQVARQNIKTWSTYWEQQVIEAQADAEAIYREEIEKAHAFSKSILLDAIAESIEAARNIHEDLPRHVIAQYYVHALEEYIKKQPGLDDAEAKKRVDGLKDFLLYNRTEGGE